MLASIRSSHLCLSALVPAVAEPDVHSLSRAPEGRAQRGQGVLGLRKSESVQHRWAEIGGGEGGVGGDVGIADQSMHHRQLPRVIELKARDAFSVGQDGGRSQLLELAAIDESFRDVLLGIVVVVNDLGHTLALLRQVLDVLFDTRKCRRPTPTWGAT